MDFGGRKLEKKKRQMRNKKIRRKSEADLLDILRLKNMVAKSKETKHYKQKHFVYPLSRGKKHV